MTELPERELSVRAGEPLRTGVPVLDAQGFAVPLTSEWTAYAQIREHWSATEALYAWSTEAAGMTLDLDNNRVVVEASAEDTLAWQAWPGQPCWDLFVVDPDGKPSKLFRTSAVLVEPAVSRPLT